MLEMFFSNTLKKLFEVGVESFEKQKELQLLVVMANEVLIRELKLNLDLIDELEKIKPGSENFLQVKKAIAMSISTKQFDELTGSGVPLSSLFAQSVDKEQWKGLNAQDRKNVENINRTCDLVERTYHRLKIFKIRIVTDAVGKTRKKYLKTLILVLLKHLQNR